MKKKKLLGFVTLAAVAVLGLTACGGSKSSSSNSSTQTEDASKFVTKVKNSNKAIKGGTLDVAVVTDTQFKGMFSEAYFEDAYDDYFMRPAFESLFSMDDNFTITDEGVAKLKLDKEAKTATVTLQKGVKWSDGQELTADDVIYPYELIGNKDYTGVRYDDNFQNVVGMAEYHDGKASTISGIEKVDNYTVKITYKEMTPDMLQAGGAVNAYAIPKHVFQNIAIKDQDKSDAVRKNPVTFGPYVISKVTTGESVEYTPNKYYYKGTPKLDKIVFTSVPSASITEALKAKKYDMVYSMPTDTYTTYKDTDGYQMLGRQQLAYTYLGFKQGKWDSVKGEVVTDKNAKMSNKNLRQAMAYAIDNNAIGEKFYNGLRSNGTTLIPTIFKELHDSEIKGYTLDIKKAKKLLDEAGYKDTDKDGYREDANGKKLTINFASMSGGETAQPIADYYIQQWKKIGLRVELTTGRLLDFQSFYDKLKNDDPGIDVYQAAWGLSSAPSPAGLYSKSASYNYARYSTDESEKLLKAIDSKESFNSKTRKENYDAWQKYMYEQAVVVPTLYRNEVMPVNNRVKGFDWSYGDVKGFYGIELTSKTR